jgi:propanol-preferring alcohol dehydrogenase
VPKSYVADVSKSALDAAKELGVSGTGENIREFADKGLDVIIDFAGFEGTTASAVDAVKPGGRVVQVGLGSATGTIPLLTLVMKQVEIVGSLAGTLQSCADVLELIRQGKVKPEIHTIGFDGIAQGLEQLEKGGVSGRLVAKF